MDLVAVSNLYNWVLKDPVLDWFELYGDICGHTRDTASEHYLEAADYGLFVRGLASKFENRVLSLIRERVDVASVEGARGNNDSTFEQTTRLIFEGRDAIYQGLVRDPDLEVFGVPDLIIRGHALERLAPGTIADLDPDEYFVLDIKFKGLELNKRGDLKASHAWERVQLALYERALSTMRRREPMRAFVIGRRVSGEDRVGGGCFDCIPWVGPLDDNGLASVGDGLVWLSDVRKHGAAWTLDPLSDPRLLPNSKNTQDSPWHEAKKKFVRKQEPGEGWEGPHVQPTRIEANRHEWYEPGALEFFVDYETFNGMNDDFSALPLAGGCPMIFMIGCGHEEAGEWRFKVWTATNETHEAELAIIREWLRHMEAVRRRLSPDLERPTVFHWHSHEVKELGKAIDRHGEPSWEWVNWYDLLWRIFKEEPVRIIDTDSHSLKPVTRKLLSLGCVKTEWGEGPVSDGLAAMTAAWSCYAASRERGLPVHDALMVKGKSLMAEIEAYNEVDCKAMWEILKYLRLSH